MIHAKIFLVTICCALLASCTGVPTSLAPMERSLKQVVLSDSQPTAPVWKWRTAYPLNAPRAETFSANISGPAMAFLMPDQSQQIQLVSTAASPQGCVVTNVGGTPIENAADFQQAMATAVTSEQTQVDLILAGTDQEIATVVDRKTLLGLSQAIAEGQSSLRISEDGTPWLIVRDGGVRAKLMVRADDATNLIQVVVAVSNGWHEPIALPVEVRASSGGRALECLTVADTLERLYGDAADALEARPGEHSIVSEREDYLLPTNYDRLLKRMENAVQTEGLTMQPAFASLPGVAYPGPAILADARALAGFLMQRQLICPGDPERTGWIVFSGGELACLEEITISLDLGSGPKEHAFAISR